MLHRHTWRSVHQPAGETNFFSISGYGSSLGFGCGSASGSGRFVQVRYFHYYLHRGLLPPLSHFDVFDFSYNLFTCGRKLVTKTKNHTWRYTKSIAYNRRHKTRTCAMFPKLMYVLVILFFCSSGLLTTWTPPGSSTHIYLFYTQRQ